MADPDYNLKQLLQNAIDQLNAQHHDIAESDRVTVAAAEAVEDHQPCGSSKLSKTGL